jgi:hypothetical protein
MEVFLSRKVEDNVSPAPRPLNSLTFHPSIRIGIFPRKLFGAQSSIIIIASYFLLQYSFIDSTCELSRFLGVIRSHTLLSSVFQYKHLHSQQIGLGVTCYKDRPFPWYGMGYTLYVEYLRREPHEGQQSGVSNLGVGEAGVRSLSASCCE